MLISSLATPFITNNIIPNGGVVIPISKFMSMMMPNQTGSNPSIWTMGMNMGRQIIIRIEKYGGRITKGKLQNNSRISS